MTQMFKERPEQSSDLFWWDQFQIGYQKWDCQAKDTEQMKCFDKLRTNQSY